MKTWPYPKLFAHRGGGSLAPENTLAAMKKGRELGYYAVEFDVKLSGDDTAMLMHDATLARTTNGVGEVKNQTYDQLALLDAGSWHSPAYRDERIPKLTEVAHYLQANGMTANVEIKPCAGRESETGKRVAELCSELWRDRFVKPIISSFSFSALQAAFAAEPALPYGLLVKTPTEEHIKQLAEIHCVSLHCRHMETSSDAVDFFHAKGYKVLTYTVNEQQRARELESWGVDGIFTDNLALMAQAFPAWLTGEQQAAS